ncbi:ATPase [Clostridium sporogenes]|uniref:AAA family ATPase n=1 Tax=Clostridium sporogenes TaxID=1509 RepID=UPI0013D88775|nr:AAA family ATPase [Clostridium sporogenes]NFF65952.1 ATPase [Clostridium sporogenes]NFF98341.1 ATPase [Clostridium sporogenes]NFG05419.1 ATPase [Clostridium sporogenes]NFG50910.1 ATPase [Clostridium sporogenes]NFP83258.1 ATPase [Clostridium sporogenes]
MNRPDNIMAYDEIDLKLGIKSSLPHVKSTVAFAILLWECSDHPAELIYSEQNNNEIVLTDELEQWIIDYLADICEEEQIDAETLISTMNKNQLLKSQMESLMVAFELVWKLAKVNFVETNKASSAERTGGIRYPKKLTYTVNIDTIHSIIASNENAYIRVLMSWVGFNIDVDPECDKNLTYLLATLSEGAVFKLTDGNRDVIFNQNSIYQKLLKTSESVDINGDKEAKGSLRILKSLLSDGMNPYLKYSNGTVSIAELNTERLEEYQKRVETLLRLSSTKVIGLEELNADNEGVTLENLEENRVSGGSNILLYGVPGSGKSHTIESNYCNDFNLMERVVFHPDYMNTDFVGQILPTVRGEGDEKEITYDFTPGPFTRVLKKAIENPSKHFYLVIEEINRGNAPAIFGEIFQLLDRNHDGTSSYKITNYNIASEVFEKKETPIYIPSNLSILATMNTADQNVFTLDTAFQRRWNMKMIENDVTKAEHAETNILDTSVTWRKFNTVVNEQIITSGSATLSSEDKRLGAYFVTKDILKYYSIDEDKDEIVEKYGIKSDDIKKVEGIIKDLNSRFGDKVIKYLWDDAFKFSRDDLFESSYKSLEKVLEDFGRFDGNRRFDIFNQDIKDNLFTTEESR